MARKPKLPEEKRPYLRSVETPEKAVASARGRAVRVLHDAHRAGKPFQRPDTSMGYREPEQTGILMAVELASGIERGEDPEYLTALTRGAVGLSPEAGKILNNLLPKILRALNGGGNGTSAD